MFLIPHCGGKAIQSEEKIELIEQILQLKLALSMLKTANNFFISNFFRMSETLSCIFVKSLKEVKVVSNVNFRVDQTIKDSSFINNIITAASQQTTYSVSIKVLVYLCIL